MASNSNNSGSPAEQGEAENVDKIREILFGGQMRDYERRFDTLAGQLEDSLQRMQKNLDARIARLEKQLTGELDKLKTRLQQEKKDRVSADRDLSRDIVSLSEGIQRAAADLDDVVAQEVAGLNKRLSEERDDVLAQMQEVGRQLGDAVAQLNSSLSEVRLDREELANMLQEVALRLKGEFQMPGEDSARN